MAVLLAGCTAAAGKQETPAALGGTARCDGVEYPPLQGGAHLIGGRQPPVDYSSNPPTSGWHISGAPDIAAHFAGQTLTEPEQVSLLEEGAVVVTFNRLRDDQRRRLERLVQDRYPDRIGLTATSQWPRRRSSSPRGVRCNAAKALRTTRSTRS